MNNEKKYKVLFCVQTALFGGLLIFLYVQYKQFRKKYDEKIYNYRATVERSTIEYNKSTNRIKELEYIITEYKSTLESNKQEIATIKNALEQVRIKQQTATNITEKAINKNTRIKDNLEYAKRILQNIKILE